MGKQDQWNKTNERTLTKDELVDEGNEHGGQTLLVSTNVSKGFKQEQWILLTLFTRQRRRTLKLPTFYEKITTASRAKQKTEFNSVCANDLKPQNAGTSLERAHPTLLRLSRETPRGKANKQSKTTITVSIQSCSTFLSLSLKCTGDDDPIPDEIATEIASYVVAIAPGRPIPRNKHGCHQYLTLAGLSRSWRKLLTLTPALNCNLIWHPPIGRRDMLDQCIVDLVSRSSDYLLYIHCEDRLASIYPDRTMTYLLETSCRWKTAVLQIPAACFNKHLSLGPALLTLDYLDIDFQDDTPLDLSKLKHCTLAELSLRRLASNHQTAPLRLINSAMMQRVTGHLVLAATAPTLAQMFTVAQSCPTLTLAICDDDPMMPITTAPSLNLSRSLSVHLQYFGFRKEAFPCLITLSLCKDLALEMSAVSGDNPACTRQGRLHEQGWQIMMVERLGSLSNLTKLAFINITVQDAQLAKWINTLPVISMVDITALWDGGGVRNFVEELWIHGSLCQLKISGEIAPLGPEADMEWLVPMTKTTTQVRQLTWALYGHRIAGGETLKTLNSSNDFWQDSDGTFNLGGSWEA
ncbi:hypothetical protein C8J56DRAFT_907721 [Mycena floridula]|nr:hypothetical protein C8J56DRAFT_907721 [Mycena floridula]